MIRESDWLPSSTFPFLNATISIKPTAGGRARLPPETASYGGGMSRWEKEEAGGRVGAGSSTDRSSWTPYQLGQTDVCFKGRKKEILFPGASTLACYKGLLLAY